jgi:RimJ/RimL family protein N-acetyltransferase
MSGRSRRARRPAKKAPQKPFTPSAEPRASTDDVEMVEGRGTPRNGGGPGGHYWHIRYRDDRAGRAYINYHATESGDPRPSITVELNERSRGHGIGTVAFRKACQLSQYDEVFASVRKGNIASRKALERAGFKPVEDWEGSELYLVWKRHES